MRRKSKQTGQSQFDLDLHHPVIHNLIKMSNSTADQNRFLMVDYKPIKLTEHQIAQWLTHLYGMKLTRFSEFVSYDDRNYYVHVSKEHNNPYLREIDPNGYVFKVFNAEFSKNENLFDGLYSLSDYVRKNGVPTPERIPNMNGKLMSLEKMTGTNNFESSGNLQYMVILQTFIPGVVMSQAPLVPTLFYEFGKLIGSMHESLKGFHHSIFDQISTSSWSLTFIPRLKQYSAVIEDESDRNLIEDIVDAFIEEITPVMPEFQRGQIHGDLNDLNVLVKERYSSSAGPDTDHQCIASQKTKTDFVISGIIDFGDASFSYFIFDIAIAISYMMINSKLVDPIDVSGHILAGYLSEFHMNSVERNALYVLICSRIAQSLAIGWYTYLKDNTNDYPMSTAARGWPLLHSIWKKPRDEIQKRWDFIIKTYGER